MTKPVNYPIFRNCYLYCLGNCWFPSCCITLKLKKFRQDIKNICRVHNVSNIKRSHWDNIQGTFQWKLKIKVYLNPGTKNVKYYIFAIIICGDCISFLFFLKLFLFIFTSSTLPVLEWQRSLHVLYLWRCNVVIVYHHIIKCLQWYI